MSDYPLYKTISFRFFTFASIHERIDELLRIIDMALTRDFVDAGNMDVCSYFPRRGPQVKLDFPRGLDRIRELLAAKDILSFSLYPQMPEYHFTGDTISMGLRGRSGNNKVNDLTIYKALTNISATDFIHNFLEIAYLFDACYAFASLHIDSTDSAYLDEQYEKLLPIIPVDYLNINRYKRLCDKFIKGVGWLNFFTKNHLSQIDSTRMPELMYQTEKNGCMGFAISESPLMCDLRVLQKCRVALAPIIIDERPKGSAL